MLLRAFIAVFANTLKPVSPLIQRTIYISGKPSTFWKNQQTADFGTADLGAVGSGLVTSGLDMKTEGISEIDSPKDLNSG